MAKVGGLGIWSSTRDGRYTDFLSQDRSLEMNEHCHTPDLSVVSNYLYIV